MKSSLRQLFTWSHGMADTAMLTICFLGLSLLGTFLHEFGIAAGMFILAAAAGTNLGNMAKDHNDLLIPWMRVSLLSLVLASLVSALASGLGYGYWGNYVASLCCGVWGYAVGTFLGLGEYWYLERKKQRLSKPLAI